MEQARQHVLRVIIYVTEHYGRRAPSGAYAYYNFNPNIPQPGASSPEALERLLGTQEHRVAAESESCADLILKAAKVILQQANISITDITRIIVSATPGDLIEPATFPLVHERLGASCPAMEIKASCVGWLSGVDVAAQYLANPDNQEELILVLAGALMSRTVPVRRVQHRAIFADGADCSCKVVGKDCFWSK